MISGRVAGWLRAQREQLNLRVRVARACGCEPDTLVLDAWLRHLLPELDAPEVPDALLQATFDLVLTLVGKRRLPPPRAASEDAQVALLVLLPELVGVFAQRPALLAAFSNAAGNLGGHGGTFVRTLPALTAVCPVDDLLTAGAVLAWRLGESRLRQQALAGAVGLAPEVVAVALAVPVKDVTRCLADLHANSWLPPGGAPQHGATLKIIGDYQGLGGPFAMPPRLLDSSHDHCLRLRCGADHQRVEVDAFGWRCLPARDGCGDPSRPALPDGLSGLIADADSWLVLPTREQPQVLVCAFPDSFRIRIVALGAQ